MQKIFKYVLTNRHTTEVSLPKDSVVLHAALKGVEICLWARVDTDKPAEKRYFSVVGTGWDIDENMCYIGTVHEGSFVWHVMEIV